MISDPSSNFPDFLRIIIFQKLGKNTGNAKRSEGIRTNNNMEHAQIRSWNRGGFENLSCGALVMCCVCAVCTSLNDSSSTCAQQDVQLVRSTPTVSPGAVMSHAGTTQQQYNEMKKR